MQETTVFEAHSSYVLGLLFTSDSQTLISAGMDNVIKLWSVPGWEPVRTLVGHANSVNSIALAPNGRVLASGSTDATVKLWAFPDGQVLHTLQDRKKVVAAVRISPDGRWIAAGSYGGRARVWTLGGEDVVAIPASRKNLSALVFSPDGRTLATAGLGDEIGLWALPSGERMGALAGHQVAVTSLASIHGGRTLVSMGHERSIKFWDTGTWQETQTLLLDAPSVRGMAFSHDERLLAVSTEHEIQLLSVDSGTLQAALSVSPKSVSALAFSPDGRWLAAGAADRKIRVWDLVSME